MILLTFVIGFILGWFGLRSYILYKMRSVFKELEKEPLKNVMNIDLVKTDHTILVYNRDTEEFLAQGNTKDEITAILQKRFPNTSFMASSSNIDEVGLR